MNEETIGAIISGIAGVIAALISTTNVFSRSRSNLMKDIEMYNALPEKSKSRAKLLEKIDANVNSILIGNDQLSRSPSGVVLAIIFLAAGGYLTWFFIDRGSWWLWGLTVSISMLVLGLVGFIQDITKLERDKKGRPVKS